VQTQHRVLDLGHVLHPLLRMQRVLRFAVAMLCVMLWPDVARADENRRGLQVEGMIGGSACIPGRAPCQQDAQAFDGLTKPSFATGVAIGARPFRWFMVGALYRWGMFHPDYVTADGSDYDWGGQHTVALMLRPIIPIWRFDLGFNIAPGYARQVFVREFAGDRDFSQGFAMLIGPTLDVYLTNRFFLGAEVDFIFNTQKDICVRRDGDTRCFDDGEEAAITPTHQALFGLHMGWTFF
jgi:hypothetical protein